ncbi:type II secretion system F family protein [Nocardioides sp. TF02-7]|uniref:type II secretion system F family protein n=1 Tax=Nocardioides sp. TF02-7 TaxID=2917724 RepID=UPI001F06D634|nr:type II secretion system F family protein [Nocardioides sp. TF02-7]UMG91593.1 type II secretion system F family protein [Nocardioides sp. TF02-7]
MTPAVWGGLLGATTAAGVVLVAGRVAALRRPDLGARVLPYLRDLTPTAAPRSREPRSALGALTGPALESAARTVERVVGGAPSVRRRLARAGLDRTVHDFRVEQVVWGLVGFGVAAAYGLVTALSRPANSVALLLVCVVGFVLGVLLRDQELTARVRRRERAVVAEFPTVAELLALAVAAGRGPVTALDRVVRRSRGALSADLAEVLAAVRTGEPVAAAFDRLAARTGVPVVARFAHGVAVAVERGTPLTDVLHAQAADVREAGRRELIEQASRREIAMMVPVVFIVLPVTVLFAFWPGLVGLSLTAP